MLRYATFAFLFVLATGCTGSRVTGEDLRFQEVRDHSQTQEVAFDRTMRWAAQAYNSANEAVQLSEEDSGTIVVKGVNTASRMGVSIPLGYTLTMDIRGERIRFTYEVGEPVESGTRGPYEEDMDDMRSDFESIQRAVLNAIETDDDF